MLIRFAVENYKSFKEQQVFSMVAGKQTRHSSHYFTAKGKRILKTSFFFGANASGKSNFVRALDFMRIITLGGTDYIKHDDRYFRIDEEYKEKPGVFQMDFIAENKVYSYGFAINYLTQKICAEWLYRIDSEEKEVCIFEREGKETKTSLALKNMSKMRFEIYSADLQENKLFLADIATKNLDKETDFEDFLVAFNWFKKLIVVYPDYRTINKNDFFLNSATNIEAMANLLRGFDTGIENIRKRKQPVVKALSFLKDDVRNRVLNKLEQQMHQKHSSGEHCMLEIGDYQFDVYLEDDQIFAEKIMLDHGNPLELFELSDESDGTKRLFDLVPLYEMGQDDKIIIIDELDRNFHSKLTEEYIRLFFEITKGKNSQLICTTHDLNLMDLNILRQDEIWFVERSFDHSSNIYSLSNFKERFDKNVLKDYIIGRYGAIPCFRESELQVDYE